MNIRPTRTFMRCLCFLGTSLFILISCSKDNDVFLDAVLTKEDASIVEEENTTVDENDDEVVEDGDSTTNETEDLESRVTVFPAINDAYLQNEEGYDHSLVRLQENFRRSYLMFDLSPIDSINGTITAANLKFVINTDDGHGTVKVFRATSNDWTENSLSDKTAPEVEVQIGEIAQTYNIGNEVEIELNTSELPAGVSTLVLLHENGDDLAFASKENTIKPGPKLEVTYETAVSSDVIVVNDSQVIEESEDESSEEDNAGDETSNEGTGNEDTTEEENTEEETGNEDTTGDDNTDEDSNSEEDSNTGPIARAEANPLAGIAPLEVNFNASNSSDDKAITSFEWDFIDGTSTSSNTTHTFSQAGSYDVTLKVTDAEGLSAIDVVTITVSEKENEAPEAQASANIVEGVAPLAVNFTGSNSTDDNSIISYQWDFKDGTSSNDANPSHTFDTPDTYEVSLTVQDEDGLTNSTAITITVSDTPVINEPPVAVATANRLTGEAPLTIDFTGSNSTDDMGIANYLWDFQGGTTSEANPSYTFTNAGNYIVTLTVTDEEGLQATSSLSVTVNPESPPPTAGPIPCSVGGSQANVPGEKVWCWNSHASEINAAGPLASFSSGQLAKSANYDGQGISVSGNRLRFKLNPNSNTGNGNNYRVEIRENPSNVDHALGTEQWFGWDYKFENDYKADAANEWIMWQVHGSFSSPAAPLVSLWVAKQNMAKNTNAAGEIFVTNAAQNTSNPKYTPTGIIPQAGQTLKIVVHVIWGDANTGLYEVWINGNKIYSEQERTVYVEQPEGGYAKWGIYKWKWQSNANVASSASQGITELNTSMGSLRSVMRRLGDSQYGQNAYSLVAPD